MAIDQIRPEDAEVFLKEYPNARYIDVRTVEEFERGHPVGAINVPIYVNVGGRMGPNSDDFEKVVLATVPKNTPLVIGCQAGARSQTACEFMEELGYETLYNVIGGFGRWLQSGLPVETENPDAICYRTLLANASF